MEVSAWQNSAYLLSELTLRENQMVIGKRQMLKMAESMTIIQPTHPKDPVCSATERERIHFEWKFLKLEMNRLFGSPQHDSFRCNTDEFESLWPESSQFTCMSNPWVGQWVSDGLQTSVTTQGTVILHFRGPQISWLSRLSEHLIIKIKPGLPLVMDFLE